MLIGGIREGRLGGRGINRNMKGGGKGVEGAGFGAEVGVAYGRKGGLYRGSGRGRDQNNEKNGAAVGGAKRAKLHLHAKGAGTTGLGVGLLRWAGL